jgi:acyl carrier protein
VEGSRSAGSGAIGAPAADPAVAAAVCALLERHAQNPPGRPLAPGDRLVDLRIDSLGLMELLFELEEAFDIKIELNANRPQEVEEHWGDVQSAIRSVERLLAARAAAPAP